MSKELPPDERARTTGISLKPSIVARLDEAAKRVGLTRSQISARALQHYLDMMEEEARADTVTMGINLERAGIRG
jgi:predicted transcriptional regulator